MSSRNPVHLAATGLALPPHEVDGNAARRTLRRLFPNEAGEFIDALVERSGIERRWIIPALDEIDALGDFSARNQRYQEAALKLAAQAAATVLERAAIDPARIDVLIDVSCTGFSIPALDVALSERLGLRPDTRRIPIAEAGCAGGALALGVAEPFVRRGANVLIVAVELASLTFLAQDRSRANLVSSTLFGDGAAAALLTPTGPGPELVATGSHLIPDSRGSMGFDIGAHGLRIILSRQLPAVVARSLQPAVQGFLNANRVPLDVREPGALGLHLIHPGGRRVLDVYAELFGLAPDEPRFAREALARYGNLSSASLFAVFDLALRAGFPLAPEKRALALGIGPGMSLEFSLWEHASTAS